MSIDLPVYTELTFGDTPSASGNDPFECPFECPFEYPFEYPFTCVTSRFYITYENNTSWVRLVPARRKDPRFAAAHYSGTSTSLRVLLLTGMLNRQPVYL
jgi:hypothetical protein